VLDQKIRREWDRLMRPVGSALGRTGLTPNAITLLGLLIQGGAAALIIDDRLALAGLVTIVAGLSDVLDGAVAKATGKTSKLGALVDSTADRVSDALFFVPVAWLYAVSGGAARDEPWVAAVALVGLVAAFLVSYVRARAESLGYTCSVGIAERAERVILMIVGLVFDVLLPAIVVLLAALSIVTVAQRLLHVRAQAAGD
jgi:CDP-diacylglycerol--glycerol-3-phosphate 3-phosphatidyltransferase